LFIRERLLKVFVAATPVAPFASITWIRFQGSPALPRRTLSLCPQLRTGWLPANCNYIATVTFQCQAGASDRKAAPRRTERGDRRKEPVFAVFRRSGWRRRVLLTNS